MLMQMGSVSFEVYPFNTHEYAMSSQTDFVRKPVLGARQPLEYVGEGEQKLTIQGKLIPRHLGGLNTMAEVHAMRVAASGQLLVRGDGKVLGWFVIETVEENSTMLGRDGVGQQIDFTITLARADKPSPDSFVFGLFGAAA